MTSGSTLTHLIVMRLPRRPQSTRLSDPLVVAHARALPEEADERVALVIARQSSVVLESLTPAHEQLLRCLVLLRREHGGARVAQSGKHRNEVDHGNAPAPIDGPQPLAVVDDIAVFAGLKRPCQLLNVAVV